MAEYYCHYCAKEKELIQQISSTCELIRNDYQQDKFVKHTQINSSAKFKSVFDSPSTGAYGDYIVNASCSGSVEIDHKGRKNIIWFASEKTGAS